MYSFCRYFLRIIDRKNSFFSPPHEIILHFALFWHAVCCFFGVKYPKSLNNRVMKKYICTVCGYVYDPAVGDPDAGIPAGTDFESLPDDWVCPLCGVTKEDFEPSAD